ncbi:MAG: aminotransferase class I/II-fold pyridoxal phosphate-dependent enzyme [Spirochaetales bacterium]|nr:aminotransferase class I/II-fold pyridoxal phosphate-dependent enzyme [Spirochaetales bacterium]
MRAIILAAGMGKRLGSYTREGTKCMVEVDGKALIDHALEAIGRAGIRDVTLVVGYRKERLMDHVGDRYPDLRIEYVDNAIYDRTNNIYSLWLARERMAQEDILLLESDLIFEPSLISEVLDDPSPNLAVVSRFESWMDGTVTMLGEDGRIVSVIDKEHFSWNDVGDYYKTVNIYKFSKDFLAKYYLPFLDAWLKAFGDNVYYEQVLKVLAFLEDIDLKGHRVEGRRWYEIDDPHDLKVAETLFSSAGDKLDRMNARYGGFWRFPALRDYCYLVNPYFPTERLSAEIRSSFADLVGHYPSGAAVQSQLAAKVFGTAESQIVVGNGAAELIDRLFRFVPGKAATAIPAFNEYPARIGAERFVPIPTAGRNFAYGADDLLEALSSGADAAVLVNPDNPSGRFMPEAELRRLVAEAGRLGKRLVVDESFVDFAERAERFTLIEEGYLRANPHLVVIKSISKSYGVPGFRLGVLASGDGSLVAAIRKDLPVWNINSFGEFFLQVVDKYKADYRLACDRIAAERARFIGLLEETGALDVYPSAANYVMCGLREGPSARELAERLLDERQILIKDLSGKAGFPEGQYIRLAVRDREDDDYFIKSFREVLGLAEAERKGETA